MDNKKLPLNEMTITTPKDIGRLIKARRKESGITQQQAAGMCNVGVRFFSELENGKPTLEMAKVIKVLEAFGFQCVIKARG